MQRPSVRVAVVGGGVAGSSAALHLAEALAGRGTTDGSGSCCVVLFDWGRGPGGRAAHRRLWVNPATGAESFVAPPPPPSPPPPSAAAADAPPPPPPLRPQPLGFDHGCQFIQASDPAFQRLLREMASQKGDGVVREWRPRRAGWVVVPPRDAADGNAGTHFLPAGSDQARAQGVGLFGLLDVDATTYVCGSPGGNMTALAAHLQERAKATGLVTVHQQHRVISICRCSAEGGTDHGGWRLGVDSGHHEMAAAKLRDASGVQGNAMVFSHVIFTEHMVWLPAWHPCHVRGLHEIVPRCVDWVRRTLRYDPLARRFAAIASLFTLMVAFESPVPASFDVACVAKSKVLQLVVNQGSRHAHAGTDEEAGSKGTAGAAVAAARCCWVLVSTREFSEACLRAEPMSAGADTKAEGNDAGVEYRPQEEAYLRADPAEVMLGSFLTDVLGMDTEARSAVHVTYCRCQRWGGAYPLPRPATARTEFPLETNGAVVEHGDFWELMVPPPPSPPSQSSLGSCLAHVEVSGGLLCAGDYCRPVHMPLSAEGDDLDLARVRTAAAQKKDALSAEQVALAASLIERHGPDDHLAMCRDVELNHRKMTLGRIEKLCTRYLAQLDAEASIRHEEDRWRAAHPEAWRAREAQGRQHVQRAFVSGRAAATRVLEGCGVGSVPCPL